MKLTALATQAARAAARLRADHGIAAADAVCPFDLAERLGICVRLVALPTLEGMYAPDPKPTILVSADRPVGRRRYTCAHELGHHVFGHGTRLDELAEDMPSTWSPEELLAHRFSAALLMPKFAVEAAFSRRGCSVSAPTPEELFVVAQELGVGYTTLVGHLERTLRSLPSTLAATLRRHSLRRLRAQMAGFDVPYDAVVADEHWGSRPIDLEIGDIALVPRTAEFTGSCALLRLRPAPHLVAVTPGEGEVTLAPHRPRVPLRVSRRAFTGIARYRHLEEAPDGR